MSNVWLYHNQNYLHPNDSKRLNKQKLRSGVQSLLDGSLDNIPPPPEVHVEFFTNEKSLKERLHLYFIKNQRSSLRIRVFNFVIKFLSCVLYVVRVIEDNGVCECSSLVSHCHDQSWKQLDYSDFKTNRTIYWQHIVFVCRSREIWWCQVVVAIISLAETILMQYLSYKGTILHQIFTLDFILELINSFPFIITIFYKPIRNLFIPVFLNCWLAKISLQNIFNDLHRVMLKSQSALAQQLMILMATMFCVIFTSICGIQHLQRAGNHRFSLFDSLWYVVVTFSTVGYGDIYPDIWPSQLFMLIMICTILTFLPSQIEQLAYTWLERQKQGGSYSSHRAQSEKHVVVCSTNLQSDFIMDFLNEFYAHAKLQSFYVVLLSPCELDSSMKVLLQVPLWAQRVIYIRGSALKNNNLERCRMQDAEACFILASRNYGDKNAADQHTILRTWAIKEHAPSVPLYVQIFRPEHKFHVKFAEHVVCEDEFKYAILANNCLCPAISTFVTLLLHTSRGNEGQNSSEEWQRQYGSGSGNEIYQIKLGNSKFFGEYEGKSFTFASFHAHRKYGVSLLGVQKDSTGANIQLNPGPRHIMKSTDFCFYMNITKEENSAFVLSHPNQEEFKQTESIKHKKLSSHLPAALFKKSTVGEKARSLDSGAVMCDTSTSEVSCHLKLPSEHMTTGHRPSIGTVPAVMDLNLLRTRSFSESSDEEGDNLTDVEDDIPWMHGKVVRGFPPVTPYIGTSPTLCHLMAHKREACCLELAKACVHFPFKHAKEYQWATKAIILASDYNSSGIYNFIVPLRSHARLLNTLNPIILMFEKRPDENFLEAISYFPMVYWMIGSIDCIDDLLRAGINIADNVIIVNKESSNSILEEEMLADCNTIVAVQTIFRLFPSASIITELSQYQNMRFMQFSAKAIQSSSAKLTKIKKSKSSLSYMFGPPFAAGSVFSASMMDTLLYQAFVKDYLITFTRLLLGVDQAVGSGHLTCIKIKREDLWIKTYGRLYQKLCSSTCEIPIGIFRTKSSRDSGDNVSPTPDCVRDQSSINMAFKNSIKLKKYNHPGSGNVPHMRRIGGVKLSAERQEISQLVKCRMACLGQPLEDYDNAHIRNRKHSGTISYVIINPSYDLKIQLDDVVYLIRPSAIVSKASPRSSRVCRQHSAGLSSDNEDIDWPPKDKDDSQKPAQIPVIYIDDDEKISTSVSHDMCKGNGNFYAESFDNKVRPTAATVESGSCSGVSMDAVGTFV